MMQGFIRHTVQQIFSHTETRRLFRSSGESVLRTGSHFSSTDEIAVGPSSRWRTNHPSRDSGTLRIRLTKKDSGEKRARAKEKEKPNREKREEINL